MDHRVCVRLIKRKNIMSPQETLALKANQNDEFNLFAMERAVYQETENPFKQLDCYERERQTCVRISA